jgi:hypothetical protein
MKFEKDERRLRVQTTISIVLAITTTTALLINTFFKK